MSSMVVKNNVNALNVLNTLNKNQSALAKSLQKVSSGMKINSAADDASGYAISERMRVQIRSLDQANANTQNGSSMMKTAEGAVNSTVEILRTLKEKAINAANDSNTDSDRLTIQKELDQSIDQINDNANVTFNGKYLVDGSKNTKGNATYTALSNQSLAEGTTASTALTALKARNGDSLEIHDTDKVTVSYVQGGKTYTAHFDVKDEATGNIATLGDIFKKAEEINAGDKIFASADNKSILAAQVKDGIITQTQADSIAQTISTAAADYDATINGGTTSDGTVLTGLVAAQNALANDVTTATTGVSDTVGAYNAKSAAYAALVTGTTYQNVAANDSLLSTPVQYAASDGTVTTVQADYGGYLDSIDTGASSVVRALATTGSGQDVMAADAALLNTEGAVANITTLVGTATTAAAAAANVQAGLTGSSGSLTTGLQGSDSARVRAAVDTAINKYDLTTADGRSSLSADILAIGSALTALGTAAGNMITALNTAGVDTTGAAGTSANYGAYLTAKSNGTNGNDYDHKKAAYDALTGPAVLEGKTVGLAASNDTVETASGGKAITITANKDGVSGQISGFNISISDSQGNVKKSANAALDAFEETIRAQNKSDDNAITLQVGAKANQSIKVGLTDMRAEALGLIGADGTKLNISTQDKANAAINVLDNAIQKALDQQTTIGAIESRLEYTSSNLTTASENVTTSESTIRDANMAKEMTEFTKNNVLSQAAQSMLAQANQQSSSVLSLLQ